MDNTKFRWFDVVLVIHDSLSFLWVMFGHKNHTWFGLELKPIPESTDYRAWRVRFILKRFWLGWWVAIFCYGVMAVTRFYNVYFSPQFLNDINRILGDSTLLERFRRWTVISHVVMVSLICVCAILRQTNWGKRHPILLVLFLSWTLHFIPDQIVGIFFRIPTIPSSLLFTAQVILLPVHWRGHFLSQLPPLFCYFVVYPLLGLTARGSRSIYNPGIVAELILIWTICLLGVYLYERLKQLEFEAQRRLKVFIHSIAHDLRTPIIGTSMFLQSLLYGAVDGEVRLSTAEIEQLLQGSDRLLNLMNSLLDAQTQETTELVINPQPIHMRPLLDSVLSDFQGTIRKNRIQINNRIGNNLPVINADSHYLWRVLCNLISNAIKHNPPGISLIFDAEIVLTAANKSELRFTIQDTGIGIPQDQQEQLFDLYVRGENARYMPGLGLGLYVCQQIISAHGGKIGVVSQAGKGSTFWFTIPI